MPNPPVQSRCRGVACLVIYEAREFDKGLVFVVLCLGDWLTMRRHN